LKRAPPHISLLLSKKHLPLYLAEFNHRKSTDGERTFSAEKGRGETPHIKTIEKT
jgi:hypothetical protein